MKRALLIPLMGATVVSLSSCGNLATSLNNQNFAPGMNPLDSPGSGRQSEPVDLGPKFEPGSWVEVTDSNAGFYRRVPRGNEQAEFSLKLGTPLKVVGGQSSYVKVETESGQIGYVPAIMVGTKPTGDALPIVSPEPAGLPPSIEPIDSLSPLPSPAPAVDPLPYVAPEPEVPPISVEDAPLPPSPIVPPDPVGRE